MNVYEFDSRWWPIRALTPDRTGNRLPAVYAPWDIQRDGAVQSTLTSKDVLYGIVVRHGFFLTSVASESSQEGERYPGCTSARIGQPPPLLETLSGCSTADDANERN